MREGLEFCSFNQLFYLLVTPTSLFNCINRKLFAVRRPFPHLNYLPYSQNVFLVVLTSISFRKKLGLCVC